jgi:hypothetical protein
MTLTYTKEFGGIRHHYLRELGFGVIKMRCGLSLYPWRFGDSTGRDCKRCKASLRKGANPKPTHGRASNV